MVTMLLVTVIVNMTNAQGEVISMCIDAKNIIMMCFVQMYNGDSY
jgi:hypothetical protein